MDEQDVNLNLTVNDQAADALKGVADQIDRAAAAQAGLNDAVGATRDKAAGGRLDMQYGRPDAAPGRSPDRPADRAAAPTPAAAPPRVDRHNPDLDDWFSEPAGTPQPRRAEAADLRHNPDLDDLFGKPPAPQGQPKADKAAPPPKADPGYRMMDPEPPPRQDRADAKPASPALPRSTYRLLPADAGRPGPNDPTRGGAAAPPKPDAGPASDKAAALAENTRKGSEALDKLAESISRVTEAERKMLAESNRLTQQQASLQKQKDAFEKKRKEELALAKQKVTVGHRVMQTAQGAQQLAGGGASGGLALLGRAGPWGAAAAAAVGAFEQGMQRATTVVNLFQNGALTAAQKMEGLKEEFVPFYQTIKKFREALDGTTETLARNNRERARAAVRTEARATTVAKERDLDFQYQNAVEMKSAVDRFGNLAPLQKFDRSSAIGERRSLEQDMVYEKEDQAQRTGAAAAGERAGAIRQERVAAEFGQKAREADERARQKSAEFRAKREQENLKPEKGRDKAGIDTAAKDAEIAAAEAAKANAQWQAEINRAKEQGLKATEAEHAARMANVEVAKAELDVLKQREARMAGLARSVGRMSHAERAMAVQAAKQVQEHVKGGGDIADLPPQFVDMAAKIAPEFVNKQAEKSGEKFLGQAAKGELRGIDDSVINDFQKQTLAEVRAQVDRVKADIRVTIQLDAKQTATDLLNEVSKVMKDWKASLEIEFRQKVTGQEDQASARQSLEH